MLVDRTVRDLLAAFASPEPTPGGGSASALASSMGTALLLMVAGMPRTRSGTDEDRAALCEANRAVVELHRLLIAAIDRDSTAYEQVLAAYKLPKATESEKSARKESIQRAMRAATEVPLDVMRLSSAALRHATAVAVHGNPSAVSDVGVAVALLRAGMHGALLNIEINVGSITDTSYVDAVRNETERLLDAAAR